MGAADLFALVVAATVRGAKAVKADLKPLFGLGAEDILDGGGFGGSDE